MRDTAPGDRSWLRSPVHGVVLQLLVCPGQQVRAGEPLLVQESMKMELPLLAPHAGQVLELAVAEGEVVEEGQPLVMLHPLADLPASGGEQQLAGGAGELQQPAAAAHPSGLRPSLQALRERLAQLQDAARPEALAKRQDKQPSKGRMSARQNVAALLDAGSFSEYGGLAIAAQRSRRELAELQAQTPADGLITGTGTVDGVAIAVMAYDYTVLAGTQGVFNHRKSDRLLALAAQNGWPLVLWAEGGGGRPGDVDWLGVAGLDCSTFSRFADLSGQVPVIGIASGRCFAGNAALLGCCDVVIATAGSSIGLAGPAMIEGGGLGLVAPDAVGPVDELAQAGAIDVLVADDAAAVQVARQILGLLQRGPAAPPATSGAGAAADSEAPALREVVPAGRSAVFDPRDVVRRVADTGSVLELRPAFGRSVFTGLARLHGQPVAVAASCPAHLGGALDAPSCDKLARFMQLADGHGLPLITLVDTPGFMVGPASEKTAMLRHAARVFVTAAKLRVPVLSVVLRRGFGLGAMALTAGHFHAPVAICAWPDAEFGAMGLEGAVRLGFRKELEAASETDRPALFQSLLAQAIDKGQALNMASFLEIDEVIDPAHTRAWLLRHLAVLASRPLPARRSFIDPW